MNREELKKLGLDDEAITKVLDIHHAEINPLKSEKERADKLQEDFNDQKKKIDDLEKAGGDSAKLQEQIDSLKSEAATKEAEHKKALTDMATKLDESEFDKIVDLALTKNKAKRKSAVLAELDLETLRASKNRGSDIEEAIKALAEDEETSFLFGLTPEPTGEQKSFPGKVNKPTEAGASAAARAAMGLPAEKGD